MKTTRLLLSISLFLLISVSTFGVAKPFQQEKVYLHFDNTAYFLGETIWFKAYVVQTGRNSLSPLSKTLYVDLITPEGDVVESKKIKLTDGKGVGDFTLKDSLRAGFYEVRAYTRFVLNQGDEAVFSRVFACYAQPSLVGDYSDRRLSNRNNFESLYNYRPKDSNAGSFKLLFYPEGGTIIEGAYTRMAFQALDKDGSDAPITGVVVGEKGDTLATLTTQHQGMGSFFYTPGSSKAKAIVVYKEKKYQVELPKPQKTGYTLNVDNSEPDYINLIISRSAKTPVEKLGVDISCRGQLYGEDTLSLYNGNVMALRFPKKMLPSGVAQITLHSADGRPIAQRLIFVNHNSLMHMEAKANKSVYQPYERINVELELNDSKGKPIETELSLAVRDASTTPVDLYADNMVTNLLLSSELKGYIQSPGYYFQDDTPQRSNDLDLLMMIQGWTRYDWKRIADIDTTQFLHPYEQSLLIEGNAYTLNRKKAKKDLGVTMILTSDGGSQHGTCVTDKDGRFNMELGDFFGKGSLLIETKEDEKRKEHIIRLDRVFSPVIRAYNINEVREPDWTVAAEELPEISETTETEDLTWMDTLKLSKNAVDIKSRLLPQVEVNANRATSLLDDGLRDASVAVNVEESLDRLLDRGEWVPATALSAILELIPYFTCNTETGACYKGKSLAILVDNKPLEEVARQLGISDTNVYDMLFQFSSIDLSMLTIREGFNAGLEQYGLNPGDYEATLYLYTDPKRKVPIGIRNTTFQGYTLNKSFYSPPYDILQMPDVNDVRRTLYWDPFVKTDKHGKAKVSFFNNRSCKTINISAETVTENGIIGSLNQ